MNIESLIAHLGHSSAHKPFDDFLGSCGMKKRPRTTDSYPYLLKSSCPGLSLGFEDDPADLGIERKSAGEFVFTKISLDFTSTKEPFSGDLPFGVGRARTKDEVLAVLGSPRTQGENPVDGGAGISYFIQGLVCVFSYADSAGACLSFVSLSLPDDSDREFGLAPV